MTLSPDYARLRLAARAGVFATALRCLLLLVLATACRLNNPDVANAPVLYTAPPADALQVAADVLRSQGWSMGTVDADLLFLEGEQQYETPRLQTGRPGGSQRGTRVRRVVVIQAMARPEGGSEIRATFNIETVPDSGIRRNFDASSPEALRLRDAFFDALNRELGGSAEKR
jgi:hypothetical protein